MPPGVGIIRRNPHETMHAGFRLQPAIGIVALHQQRRGFDARLFTGGKFLQLHLEAALLGPAGIHAQQHVRPVLAFRAARARMHLDKRVRRIHLARQQRFHLHLLDLGHQRLDAGFSILDRVGVALFLAHRDQLDAVAQRLVKALDGINHLLQPLALLHQLLGFTGVVPKIGIFGAGVQIVETFDSGIPVKDASSAGRDPA